MYTLKVIFYIYIYICMYNECISHSEVVFFL